MTGYHNLGQNAGDLILFQGTGKLIIRSFYLKM